MNEKIKYRYAMKIEYIGLPFHGWQKQPDQITVQGVIESALQSFYGIYISICGSGRTDTGVNALAQVAHFDLEKKINTQILIKAINFYIEKKYKQYIQILNIINIDNDFHARFSCMKRTYLYQITRNNSIHNKQNRLFIRENELVRLNNRYRLFIGENDFINLRSAQCSAKITKRTIYDIHISCNKLNDIDIYITSRAFLHNQVRYMISSMLYLEFDRDLFHRKPRISPAYPLYLYSLRYDNNIFDLA